MRQELPEHVKKSCFDFLNDPTAEGLIWKDITSYSSDDKEKIPIIFQTEIGDCKIFITCGHIHHPGEFIMGCHKLGFEQKQLFLTHAKLAAEKAIEICRNYVKKLQDAFFNIPAEVELPEIINQDCGLTIALTSPALKYMSDRNGPGYPAHFKGKVPLKVKMCTNVKADLPFLATDGIEALEGIEYYVYVNSYGAVSAILPNGEQLGLKPGEFEVTAWHEDRVDLEFKLKNSDPKSNPVTHEISTIQDILNCVNSDNISGFLTDFEGLLRSYILAKSIDKGVFVQLPFKWIDDWKVK